METLLNLAIEASLQAGKAIMEVYAQPFEVYTKDDDSPVTQADLRASAIIKEVLKPSGLPFVSEEDLPPDRSQFGRYWLVDPLDGTAEFVNRNGEFTVNIALIENKRPVLGVIYAPTLGMLWHSLQLKIENSKLKIPATLREDNTKSTIGIVVKSKFENGILKELMRQENRIDRETDNVKHSEEKKTFNSQFSIFNSFTVLVSRSHRTQEVDDYIDRVLRPVHPDLVIDSQGSSLKFARLAEGSADVYVCYSKTKEWDTAAADAILTAAGGQVLRISDGKPLDYDKEEYPNPPFVAWAPGVL